MKILDRYIAKKFIFNFFIGVLGSLVIFFSFDFLEIIQQVTVGKLSISEVPFVIVASIPSIISYEIMHLASLIGSLITMNDMNNSFEIIALQTSGIKFSRIIRTPLILSTFIALSLFLFTEYVSTGLTKEKRETWRRINGVIVSKNRDNIYYKSGNRFYRIDHVNGYENRVSNIQYVDLNGYKAERIVNAKEGKYDPDKKEWILESVHINIIKEDKVTEHEIYEADIKESIEDFLKYKLITSDQNSADRELVFKDLTFNEIRDNINFLQASGGNYKKLFTHVHHQRLAYPFSIIIMTLIGLAMLSKYSREGRGKTLGIGIILGFLYYIVVEISKAIGIGAILPIIISAWIPNAIFLILGIYFLRSALD